MKTKEINISGYIGIPEWWQFDESMQDEIVSTKEKMRMQLKDIANSKVDKILLKIDSFGGDVNHGLAIYNALKETKAEIEAEYIGFSASIATVIASAADVVRIPENMMILIHEGRGIAIGVQSDMEAYSKWLKDINDNVSGIYAKKTGKTKEEMRSLMARNGGEGEWLTAQEAKELGLVDEVYEPMRAAASYDDKLMKKMQLPEIPESKLNSIINQKPKSKTMGLFSSKEKKPVNKILLGEVEAIYQGEIKTGVELAGIGSDIPDGSYEIENLIYKVENSIITSIEEKQPEMFSKNQLDVQVQNAVKPLNDKINEMESQVEEFTVKNESLSKENENLKAEITELKKLTSTHKPLKKEGVENEIENPKNFQAEVYREVQNVIKEKKQNKK